MDGDFTSRETPPPAPNLASLPEVQSLKALRVHFDQPVAYNERGARKETRDAIEIEVTTSADFPIRALAPALFVGGVPVTEFKRVGERRYRFTMFGHPDLKDQADVAIGWVGSGPAEAVDPAALKATKMVFQISGDVNR